MKMPGARPGIVKCVSESYRCCTGCCCGGGTFAACAGGLPGSTTTRVPTLP